MERGQAPVADESLGEGEFPQLRGLIVFGIAGGFGVYGVVTLNPDVVEVSGYMLLASTGVYIINKNWGGRKK